MKPHLHSVTPAFNRRLKIYYFLFVLLACALQGYSQINAYAKVTGISGTTLSLSDLNQTYHTFNSGEQVVIMQMQDNVTGTNTTNTFSFGSVASIASAGLYEIATIASVSGLPTSLTITVAPSNTYHFNSNSSVQIISFRKYGSPDYTTAAAITALSWNGKIGGVIAMQVAGTLTLAHNISANGQGFRGGALSSNYEVNCEPLVYASSSLNYAGKGEGIEINTTGLTTGRAPVANGGGGGSDDNGGGAGGSNYSDGGEGGHGWTCSANPSGGLGGKALSSYISSSRVFLGGGGGGGQQNNSVGTVGGNGGGIVLIKANSITTTGSAPLSISANGATAGNSGNDGAGGGGAGGSVVLSVNSFSIPSGSPLSVLTNGGAGGNVNDAGAHGGGGGGGQGVVLYSSAQPSANVTTIVNNGTGGNNNSSGASAAGVGATTNNTGIMAGLGATVLPVKLANLAAQLRGSEVIITWNTLTEQNNDHFKIQRSADGIGFTTIGTVKGAVNSSRMLSYSFLDDAPLNGKNLYRLQQVDLDGHSAFSPTVSVDLKSANTGIQLFPNPASEQFTIKAASVKNSNCTLSITDLSGKTVLNMNATAVNGQIPVSLHKKLTPGIYAVRLVHQQQILYSKLVIQ